MQQSSTTPKKQDVGIGLRKIVACSHSSSQSLLVSTVFGTVSSLHFYTNIIVARGEAPYTRTYMYVHIRTDMRIVHANCNGSWKL